MSKHQWLHRVILVAGTIVLASACTGEPGECEYNDVTGESFCNGGSVTGPSSAPAQDVINHPDELRAAPTGATKTTPRQRFRW